MVSFADLLAPTTLNTFFAAHWEQQPLAIQRADQCYYRSLLSFADIDHILTSTTPRHPDFRLVKDGATLPLARYTRQNSRGDAVADVDKILTEYSQGVSIVLESLHERWQPLAYLCRELEQHLSHPVQTNIYLTPRSAQGFAPHYDTHDVFVLQIHGTKHWRIYDAPVHLPDRSLPHHTDRARLGPPLNELSLAAGDLLYLPRGFVHEALTAEEESLHITVGILTYTWFDVFTEVLTARRRADVRFRASLPAGFAGRGITDGMRDCFRELAAALGSDGDVDDAVAKIAARFVASRRPLLDGALVRFYDAEDLTVESTVRPRASIIFRLITEGDTVILQLAGKQITLPDYVEPSLHYLMEVSRTTVHEIPGELDDAGKLVLVRSLLREGVLTLER